MEHLFAPRQAENREIPDNPEMRLVRRFDEYTGLGLGAAEGLWLLLLLEAAPRGGYFYAPFAGEGPEADTSPPAAVPPALRLELRGGDERILEGVTFYYPPGEIKADPFSGISLPVYAGEALILAFIPEGLRGKEAELRLSAVLCTDKSCAPFSRSWPLRLEAPAELAAADNSPPFLPAEEKLRLYRSEPFNLPDKQLAAPDFPAGRRQETEKQAWAGQGGFADYLASLSPRSPERELEVSGLGQAVLLGFPAGFILNFMPCVLPVITLKLGGLLGLGGAESLTGDTPAARRGRRRLRLYSLCFASGVFTWFAFLFAVMGLAGLMWGQFFQSQTLLIGLSLLLFLLALRLLGLLRLPAPRIEPDQRASLPCQAFLGGMLATLLATPCSGPLLGGVLAWAVGQSLFYLGLTLCSVALGMSAPFLLLGIRPGMVRHMPKPGAWNRTLENFMGFMLLGTVIYLLSLLPAGKVPFLLLSFLLLAFCLRLPATKSIPSRICAAILIPAALLLPFMRNVPDTRWQSFSPDSFRERLGRDNLLLDFTADWCINCRALELSTLSDERLARWAELYALRYIKVDLTRPFPQGEALLHALGSVSIPFLAVIPARAPLAPLVLRDLVTPGQMEAALRQALR
ncbi:MAG: hypothetical protein LBQ63_06930 [Deltaproteobacteria bacterium]|nr:hypothetical protein [Deltaproteobacteria bacterium]